MRWGILRSDQWGYYDCRECGSLAIALIWAPLASGGWGRKFLSSPEPQSSTLIVPDFVLKIPSRKSIPKAQAEDPSTGFKLHKVTLQLVGGACAFPCRFMQIRGMFSLGKMASLGSVGE